MKTLIVYYSLEGNTRWAAEQIAAALDADVLALHPKATYPDKGFIKFLWGGKSALMKEAPDLEPYAVELPRYGRVILATPVWAGTFAPPLRTFLQSEDLSGKDLAIVACSMSGSPGKTFDDLKSLLRADGDVLTLSLQDPKSHPSEKNSASLETFCRQLR